MGQIRTREELLLYTIHELDKSIDSTKTTITRIQKIIFLIQNGGFQDDPIEELRIAKEEKFEFEANDYGPFSRELYNCIEQSSLINDRSTSAEDNKEYTLNTHGKEIVSSDLLLSVDSPTNLPHNHKVIKSVVTLYGDRPIIGLIDDLIRKYPNYTKSTVLSNYF